METNLVLHEKTHHITVNTHPGNTAHLSKETLGNLTLQGGIPAYILSIINTHNQDPHAHPALWYIHEQATASDEWTIEHNLNKFPSVSVVDTANTIVSGLVTYIDENTVKLEFNGAFKGKAYLN